MSGVQSVVVSDTNIFIDLIDLELFGMFLELGYEIHTNIFVLNELVNTHQKECVINSNITIERFESTSFSSDIVQFFNERQHKSLSFTDCSVLYQGIKLGALVLTGDKKMIMTAKELDISVHGILFIFDQLVENKIMSRSRACEKLQELYKRNRRLPLKELDKRLKQWNDSIPLQG